MTNETGRLRFPVLPPGLYALEIEMPGFATLHDRDILIAAGSTMERTATLKRAGVEESIVVEGTGSRIEARNPGFATRFGSEDIEGISRHSMPSCWPNFLRATSLAARASRVPRQAADRL
jgi:hypothetical protein